MAISGAQRTTEPPLIFAEPRTILYVYAKHLLSLEEATRTVPAPEAPFPMRPNMSAPRFLLANTTNPQTRNQWLGRIYTMRQRWPHMPIGVITDAGIADQAEAYAAGANRLFDNLDSMEEVYAALDVVAVQMTLPERKAQILMGYSVGHCQATIAGELYLGTETVKSHTSDMFHQFDVRSKPMLVHRAFTSELFEHPSAVPDGEFPLTPMEAMTALAIGKAGSQAAAADMLDRSALTLKTHTQNVRRRLGWSVSESIANVWRWGQHTTFDKALVSA